MKARLDQVLVARGLVASRSRARDLILRGRVQAGGAVTTKPGALVDAAVEVAVDAGEAVLVSRGALKLRHALEASGIDPAGLVTLDLGASTGGFTQVLLERGATRVYAVDVGHGQLHPALAADPRVIALEGVDARALDRACVPEPIDLLVADLSFISLAKALPAALALVAPGGRLVALVKPQFEAGPQAVAKGGIVRDAAARQQAVERVVAWLEAQPGWRVEGRAVSPIAGKDGNEEHLIWAVRDG